MTYELTRRPNEQGVMEDWIRPEGEKHWTRRVRPGPTETEAQRFDRLAIEALDPKRARAMAREREMEAFAASVRPETLAEVLSKHADAQERRLADEQRVGHSLPIYEGQGELDELAYLRATDIALAHFEAEARGRGRPAPELASVPADALARDLERQHALGTARQALDRADALDNLDTLPSDPGVFGRAEPGGRWEMIDGRRAWVHVGLPGQEEN